MFFEYESSTLMWFTNLLYDLIAFLTSLKFFVILHRFGIVLSCLKTPKKRNDLCLKAIYASTFVFSSNTIYDLNLFNNLKALTILDYQKFILFSVTTIIVIELH